MWPPQTHQALFFCLGRTHLRQRGEITRQPYYAQKPINALDSSPRLSVVLLPSRALRRQKRPFFLLLHSHMTMPAAGLTWRGWRSRATNLELPHQQGHQDAEDAALGDQVAVGESGRLRDHQVFICGRFKRLVGKPPTRRANYNALHSQCSPLVMALPPAGRRRKRKALGSRSWTCFHF